MSSESPGPKTSGQPTDEDATTLTDQAIVAAEPDVGVFHERSPADLPQVEGFELSRLLGEGGMAAVYLAQDIHLRKDVAIKVMTTDLALDDGFKDRFRQECIVAANLSHPNIVAVYRAGESNDRLFMVMENLEGETLKDRIERELYDDEDDFCTVASGIASALACVHAGGAVHRDVKPSNIMFRDSGEPVLTDFGIAKSEVYDAHRTQTGFSVLSVRYASPEQLRGHQVGEKSDIYSYGLILCEMLTGQLPGQSEDGGPAPLARLFADRPGWVRAYQKLISECLSEDATLRPSASEVLEGIATQHGRGTRKRLQVASAFAAALVISVGAAFVFLSSSPDTNPTLAPVVATTPEGLRYFVDGREVSSGSDLITAGTPVALLAPGYEGRLIEANAQGLTVEDRHLPPIRYPNYAEWHFFDEVFARDTKLRVLDSAEFDTEVLQRLKTWLAADLRQADTRTFENSTQTLASLGDPVAQFAYFMATQSDLLDVPAKKAVEMLDASSESGYALATFYRALLYRTEITETGTLSKREAISIEEAERSRDALFLAAEQGLSFARSDAEAAAQEIEASRSRAPR